MSDKNTLAKEVTSKDVFGKSRLEMALENKANSDTPLINNIYNDYKTKGTKTMFLMGIVVGLLIAAMICLIVHLATGTL